MYLYWLFLQKYNFSQAQCKLPEDGPSGPKHVEANVRYFNVNFNILYVQQKVDLLVKKRNCNVIKMHGATIKTLFDFCTLFYPKVIYPSNLPAKNRQTVRVVKGTVTWYWLLFRVRQNKRRWILWQFLLPAEPYVFLEGHDVVILNCYYMMRFSCFRVKVIGFRADQISAKSGWQAWDWMRIF